VMTVVRRARKPIGAEVKAELIGEGGEVRSMLNPEGFVLVEGELWRARSEDGSRMRVGIPVTVSRIDGTVLIVRATVSGNGAAH
ncbi:MAG: NfeD family protein, partial [Actinomycetota bacterium]